MVSSILLCNLLHCGSKIPHIASMEGVAATGLRLAILIPIAKLKPPLFKAIYEFAFVPLLFPAHLLLKG